MVRLSGSSAPPRQATPSPLLPASARARRLRWALEGEAGAQHDRVQRWPDAPTQTLHRRPRMPSYRPFPGSPVCAAGRHGFQLHPPPRSPPEPRQGGQENYNAAISQVTTPLTQAHQQLHAAFPEPWHDQDPVPTAHIATVLRPGLAPCHPRDSSGAAGGERPHTACPYHSTPRRSGGPGLGMGVQRMEKACKGVSPGAQPHAGARAPAPGELKSQPHPVWCSPAPGC